MQGKHAIEDILPRLNIEGLNEMQNASLAAHRERDEVILLSATGSGKTLAYLLPVFEFLTKEKKGTQALVIVPSRELALQIESVFRTMGTGFKITCCYGGHKREIEENNLIEAPAVIVGTPGRLADHIRRGNITTESIEFLVLDEFDKTLELGFEAELSFILGALPGIKKRTLTSATDTDHIPEFIGLQEPVKIDYLPNEKANPEAFSIKRLRSDDKDKIESLFHLLCFIGNRSTIVFCNHRESVERCSEGLSQKGIVNTFYHGSMEQRDRDMALCKFRNGSVQFLITTDLAARGLDIDNIRYIVHYHLPLNEASFTHRNGRTARMDKSGTAILLLSAEEKVPAYIDADIEEITIPNDTVLPEKPKWTTLYIAAGKKNKVNKVDIAGFFTHKGQLKKEDIGLIEVKDFSSFVALRKSKVSATLQLIKEERLKNKKVKIEVAK
jgi:superfamily II DNA/RNA helicase